MRSILLLLLGVPIPIVILIAIFTHAWPPLAGCNRRHAAPDRCPAWPRNADIYTGPCALSACLFFRNGQARGRPQRTDLRLTAFQDEKSLSGVQSALIGWLSSMPGFRTPMANWCLGILQGSGTVKLKSRWE